MHRKQDEEIIKMTSDQELKTNQYINKNHYFINYFYNFNIYLHQYLMFVILKTIIKTNYLKT